MRASVLAAALACSCTCACAAAEGVAWPALSSGAVISAKAESAAMLDVARAADLLVAVGERGTVLVSPDEGRHWVQSPCPVRTTLTAVRFVDGLRGWAVGHQGVVLATRDGGAHWQLQLDGLRSAALVLAAARASGDEARIRRAEQLVAEGPDKPLFTLEFEDARHGVVAGAYGLAFATEDGGEHWQPLDAALGTANPKGRHLYAASLQGHSILLAGEQGLLLRSTDGGASFQSLATSYAGTWFDLRRDGVAWWLVGLRGHALRSDDQGRSWQAVDSGSGATLSALRAGPDGRLVMLDQTGALLVSGDGGHRFEPTSRSARLPASGLVATRDGTWVVATLRGMRRIPSPP